ncbi:MAG: translocation/assembly module TamB domain-containing protein, partial [Acidobacteriaceae bacterium]|nr:translocation/assembly module TamB domain-containing protein [Acidobacteriaceae bacterium]
MKTPDTKSIIARANLAITPGHRGMPVAGRLRADYRGANDNIFVDNSYVALPHTRLDLNGSLGKQLNIELTSRDLNDLFAALPPESKPPVNLNGGQANLTAIVAGGLTSPHLTGHLAVTQFAVQGRQFNGLAADLAASRSGAAIRNGTLNRGAMQAQVAGSVGLRNWSPAADQSLAADATIRNGDLADIMAMAGQPTEGYAAPLTADLNVTGTVGDPHGAASVQASKGTIAGEPFDEAVVRVNLTDQLATIPTAYIVSGPARVNLTAEFQHPRDSFSSGRIHASVHSNQVNLAQLQMLQKWQPNTAGQIQINADVTGNLSPVRTGGAEQNEFLLSALNADASAQGLQFEGQRYGDMTASARTKGQTVTYNVVSDFAGSNIRVNGNTQLARGYPTTADANINHLPIERLLVLARRTDIPARGSLTSTAHFTGTMDKPDVNADFDLSNAVLYDEPLDRVRARVNYRENAIDVPQFQVLAGPSRIDLVARYDHPPGKFESGHLQFRVESSKLDLHRIRNVQKMRPGLGGTLQLTASGAGQVRASEPKILFSSLKANLAANGISAQGKNLGDATLTADTASSGQLTFALDSNLAGSSISGRGNAQLAGDYPINAKLTFKNIAWNRLQTLVGSNTGEPPEFDAETDGQITVNGPVLALDRLRGSLELTRLKVHTIPGPGEKTITIQNEGPIAANLDRGIVNILSAHITGPQTDIQTSGNLGLQKQTLNLTLNAKANLAPLQNFSRQIYAAGDIVLATTARGTFTKPIINGQLQLRNASLNYADLPNGISNANGVVIFNGNTASIRNLTAESGGGKVTANGYVGYANNNLRYGLRADAGQVRVRTPQGATVVISANINLTGNGDHSVLGGNATINKISFNPHSDFGS